jgi:hypothetical protein
MFRTYHVFSIFIVILISIATEGDRNIPLEWNRRPIVGQSGWCLATPTYSKHFTNTANALKGIEEKAVDQVRMHVIVTNPSEASQWRQLASTKNLPSHTLLDLASLTRLTENELESSISNVTTSHNCHLGKGLERYWGHLKKMFAVDYLTRHQCELVWVFDAESRPFRAFSFKEIFNVEEKKRYIFVDDPEYSRRLPLRGKASVKSCTDIASIVIGKEVSPRVARMSLRENDFW